MTLLEAKSWLNSQVWKNAKSYSETFPHCYIQKSSILDKGSFEQVIQIIRELGKVKRFFSKQYIYLEIDGMEYWEMGRPIRAVQVLNRAPINDSASYRYPLVLESESKKLKSKLAEREVILEGLLSKTDITNQDLRKIKFLLDSERRIHGGGKNIIDHANIPLRYE